MKRAYLIGVALCVVTLIIIAAVARKSGHLDGVEYSSAGRDILATDSSIISAGDSSSLTIESGPNATASATNGGGFVQGELIDPEKRTSHQRLDQALEYAFLDPEGSAKFQSDIFDALEATYGTDEAFFLTNMMHARNWEEASSMIDERSKESGQDYGTLRMKTGLSFGSITTDEILTLVASGVLIPEDAIHSLARRGQADTIVSLIKAGVLPNVNSVSASSGRNALGDVIARVSVFAHEYSSAEAADAIRKLASVGVDVNPQGPGATPLKVALQNVTSRNVAVKLSMAGALLKQGAVVDSTYRELVLNIPDEKSRRSFINLFMNHL